MRGCVAEHRCCVRCGGMIEFSFGARRNGKGLGVATRGRGRRRSRRPKIRYEDSLGYDEKSLDIITYIEEIRRNRIQRGPSATCPRHSTLTSRGNSSRGVHTQQRRAHLSIVYHENPDQSWQSRPKAYRGIYIHAMQMRPYFMYDLFLPSQPANTSKASTPATQRYAF